MLPTFETYWYRYYALHLDASHSNRFLTTNLLTNYPVLGKPIGLEILFQIRQYATNERIIYLAKHFKYTINLLKICIIFSI